MPRIATATLTLSLLSVPFMASAQTVWLCGLSDDSVQLVCVADSSPVTAAEVAPSASAVVNGTRFPLDPRRVYTVDLWSPPTEMAFVEQLARATICYRSPGCNVIMSVERQDVSTMLSRLAVRTASGN